MTQVTKTQIEYTLSYLTVEAYIAGLSDGKPIHFQPGSKVNGNSPKFYMNDDSMIPTFLPALELGDSNKTVMTKLDATSAVFYALRVKRDEEKKRNAQRFVSSENEVQIEGTDE